MSSTVSYESLLKRSQESYPLNQPKLSSSEGVKANFLKKNYHRRVSSGTNFPTPFPFRDLTGNSFVNIGNVYKTIRRSNHTNIIPLFNGTSPINSQLRNTGPIYVSTDPHLKPLTAAEVGLDQKSNPPNIGKVVRTPKPPDYILTINSDFVQNAFLRHQTAKQTIEAPRHSFRSSSGKGLVGCRPSSSTYHHSNSNITSAAETPSEIMESSTPESENQKQPYWNSMGNLTPSTFVHKNTDRRDSLESHFTSENQRRNSSPNTEGIIQPVRPDIQTEYRLLSKFSTNHAITGQSQHLCGTLSSLFKPIQRRNSQTVFTNVDLTSSKDNPTVQKTNGSNENYSLEYVSSTEYNESNNCNNEKRKTSLPQMPPTTVSELQSFNLNNRLPKSMIDSTIQHVSEISNKKAVKITEPTTLEKLRTKSKHPESSVTESDEPVSKDCPKVTIASSFLGAGEHNEEDVINCDGDVSDEEDMEDSKSSVTASTQSDEDGSSDTDDEDDGDGDSRADNEVGDREAIRKINSGKEKRKKLLHPETSSDVEGPPGVQQINQQQAPLATITTTDQQEGFHVTSIPLLPRRRNSTSPDLLPSAKDLPPLEPGYEPPLTFSLFPNVPPVLNFVQEGCKVQFLPPELRRFLRWRQSSITPLILRQALQRSGFRPSKLSSMSDDMDSLETTDWIVYFGRHMHFETFKTIREYQKVNHFPGSFHLGRKDRLWRNLHRMQVQYGRTEFDFIPLTFCLPADLKLLRQHWDDVGHKNKWILKPPASARGTGIRVINKWNQIPQKRSVIVQSYISNPYLINESKFDLRVYVFVTSFDPLKIFIHQEGLVRFASFKYSNSAKSLNNRYMHLTNYSINKLNSIYVDNTDSNACQGHKWSLKALWRYLADRKIDTKKVWERIQDVVVKTMISGEAVIASNVKQTTRRRYSVTELFGFDILLDEDLNPWILEVNISPSLHSNSPLDVEVKGSMVSDMLNLSGYQLPDPQDLAFIRRINSSSTTTGSDLIAERRHWDVPLTSDERQKHITYLTMATVDKGILEILGPSDLCHLVEMLDEERRLGGFSRIFPVADGARYLQYFDQCKYYNLLLIAYLQRYEKCPRKGVEMVQNLCRKNIHLKTSTNCSSGPSGDFRTTR